MFVVLNTATVITEELIQYFPDAKILWWDIAYRNTPGNWENWFLEGYGCSEFFC
jgi:hypothetical protein